ncbi:hypothetical protein F8M41_014601 [Gigaspora margarita]|uniref:Uncharacterized protein n=1 Tax=Gigaspora margarita TaxID=4874 RepID=A0A8H4B5S6_GIGMA|nr:hypothetical protein F8M41_014601 [Gigaspora margarita]
MKFNIATVSLILLAASTLAVPAPSDNTKDLVLEKRAHSQEAVKGNEDEKKKANLSAKKVNGEEKKVKTDEKKNKKVQNKENAQEKQKKPVAVKGEKKVKA